MAYTDRDNASKKVEILLPIDVVQIPSLTSIQDERLFVIIDNTGN
jgi:hypothetical protein